jgi:ribonucleoside-diphosphate reductase alpha chain
MTTDKPTGQLNLQGVDPLHGKRFTIRKRDGRIEEFNEARIFLAIESAFKSVEGVGVREPLNEAFQLTIERITDAIVEKVLSCAVKGEQLEVERIQDAVENQLMVAGQLTVARRYILYREERRKARVIRNQSAVEGQIQS